MPKSRTKRILDVKQKLIERLESGIYNSGDRFFSNRWIAAHYGISYRTAHVLLQELEEEGYLGRKAQSGSYIAGQRQSYKAVEIYVPERAKEKGNYSAFLLSLLTEKLSTKGIKFSVTLADCSTQLTLGNYPVVIDLPFLQSHLYKNNMYGLFLNDKATPGLSSIWVDSVYCDNYSGGVSAAQIYSEQLKTHRCSVFAGPRDDWRNSERVEGFLSVIPDAYVVYASSWHQEEVLERVPDLFSHEFETVFCCNDKLAVAVLSYCTQNSIDPPDIIGFDNLPISEELGFSTIAVAWDEMIDAAVTCIRLRMQQESAVARHVMVSTRPLLRGNLLQKLRERE